MQDLKLKKIGTIGVDSGSLIIGDPGYIIFDRDQDEQLGFEWDDFCSLTQEESTSFKFAQGSEGLAVAVNVYDGTYTVSEVLDEDNHVKGYFISVE